MVIIVPQARRLREATISIRDLNNRRERNHHRKPARSVGGCSSRTTQHLEGSDVLPEG
jgi:hypothetical protein